LKRPEDFKRVYAEQAALHGPMLVLFFRPNDLCFARLGVSVGRKHGNAVRRNRIKRVFRESFRLSRDLLPQGYDYVLIPRRGVRKYRTADIRAALDHLGRRIPLPGEGTRAAHARVGEVRDEREQGKQTRPKQRRGISRRIFLKRPKKQGP
jgi:ribonuclease P protein component